MPVLQDVLEKEEEEPYLLLLLANCQTPIFGHPSKFADPENSAFFPF